MRKSEWIQAVRPLLPADQEWDFQGRLAYRLPARHLVVGLLADGSGFDKGVYIWRMVMPLFVPIDHVTLTWSERIGGGAKKYYASDDDEIASAVGGAVRLLGDEDTELEGIATNAREIHGQRLIYEQIGYAQLLRGSTVDAIATL